MLSKEDIDKSKLEHERMKKLRKRKKGPKSKRKAPGASTLNTPQQQMTQPGDRHLASKHLSVFVDLSRVF